MRSGQTPPVSQSARSRRVLGSDWLPSLPFSGKLLHKAAYDYVTFFDVYQCAISTPLLEERIDEVEQIILGRHYVALTSKVFGERTADLVGLGFVHDQKEDRYLAPASRELRDILRMQGIPSEARAMLDPAQADPVKLAQLEAVQRWFHDDWKRIEPKLRTSIVEGEDCAVEALVLSNSNSVPGDKTTECQQSAILRLVTARLLLD